MPEGMDILRDLLDLPVLSLAIAGFVLIILVLVRELARRNRK